MREIDSKENFQYVEALAKFPPKSTGRKLFHRNCIGFESSKSFVYIKGANRRISHRIQIYRIST